MSGVQANFVDTQFVALVNVTDAITYTQLENVTFSNRHSRSFHQLSDDTVDKNFALGDATIAGNIILTNPELPALKTLNLSVNGQLPIRTWRGDFTDQSGTVQTVLGQGFLANLEEVDRGESAVTLAFVLEMRDLV